MSYLSPYAQLYSLYILIKSFWSYTELFQLIIIMPCGKLSQQPEFVLLYTPSVNRSFKPSKRARQQTQKAADIAKQLKKHRFQRKQEKIRKEACHTAKATHYSTSVQNKQIQAEYV